MIESFQRPASTAAICHALLAILLVLLLFTIAISKRHERLIGSWRPVDYNVSLSLDQQLTQITAARVEITIQSLVDNLALIDLDFGELSVESVMVDATVAKFEHSTGRLNITLPKPAARDARIIVAVAYHGKPKDGLILSSDKSGKPSAIGDNWPDRLHHWIPSLDHPSAKATVRFTVTAPENALVVANGMLEQVQTASGGNRTWSYTERVPIPPYCMVIAVGDFALVRPTMPTVTPLSYYVPQVDKDVAMQGFATADPSLKFFSETVAPYPYGKLALIVGATRFGGMENSSAIVFASNLFDRRSSADPISKVFNVRSGIVSLVAHEIAHQWFGDSVTESTWADLWLSEGFATYFAALFIQRHEGDAAFRRYMTENGETYFSYAEKKRTPLHDTETENLLSLLNPNSYQKGAWILHMLRHRLGDEVFFKSLRAYYRAHENATASTEDLRKALEQTSGKNLKDFFNRWVYAAGHPNYEISWRWYRGRNRRGVVAMSIKQRQHDAPFLDPLQIEIVTPGESVRRTITPTGRETTIQIPATSAPTKVIVDPDGALLKQFVIKPVTR